MRFGHRLELEKCLLSLVLVPDWCYRLCDLTAWHHNLRQTFFMYTLTQSRYVFHQTKRAIFYPWPQPRRRWMSAEKEPEMRSWRISGGPRMNRRSSSFLCEGRDFATGFVNSSWECTAKMMRSHMTGRQKNDGKMLDPFIPSWVFRLVISRRLFLHVLLQ